MSKRGTVDSALVYKTKGPGSIPDRTEKLYTLAPLSEGTGKPPRNLAKRIFLFFSRSESALNCRSHIRVIIWCATQVYERERSLCSESNKRTKKKKNVSIVTSSRLHVSFLPRGFVHTDIFLFRA